MKTGGLSSQGKTKEYYIVTKFNQPEKAFTTLARAWVYCFEQGYVVARGRHRPGSTAAQRKHRLDYGVHVILATLPTSPPWKRGQNSKKRKFQPENWIDQL